MEKKITADAINKVPSRSRRTSCSSDFAVPHDLSKCHKTDRLSVLPQIDKNDNEAREIEVLYNKYLQGLMMQIILKQKTQETEKLIVEQLATMAKELDSNKQILFELKTRERDIKHLTTLQNEIDSQTSNIKECIKFENIKAVEDVLSRMHILLKDYDILRCDNIILPKSHKEWEETTCALKSCCNTLKSVIDLIAPHTESYQVVNHGIKDFLDTYNTIIDYHKRLEKDINQLQALALKTAALSLTENYK